MSESVSSVLTDYRPAFENSQEPFLFYYSHERTDAGCQSQLNRAEFWSLAKKAAAVICDSGCQPGDCFALCFGANHPFDLAFRLGAVMTGTVPVTINWQADSTDRIVYKIGLTDCRLVVAGARFNPEHLTAIAQRYAKIPVFAAETLNEKRPLAENKFCTPMDPESTRIIVFTSGTTGVPKGVQLPYRSYRANRSTFEQFLGIGPRDKFAACIVNPLHHANSTAITDWAMRRPGTRIHLNDRYATNFWQILTQVAARHYQRLLVPTVARHFDFLENLEHANRLPVGKDQLVATMKKTDFLIGSAPVGPTTIKRLQHWSGRIPHVRFGSTETCLQIIGTPRHLTESAKLQAFKKGWEYVQNNEARPGYYIGRPHPPYTEVRIVQSITPEAAGFMQACRPGQAGYLVTRGDNIMTGYVKNSRETRAVFHNGWYTGLKDIGFYLPNDTDGQRDYYWISRESTLMIRGGANYAYDQINGELKGFIARHYRLPREAFELAVVGLKIDSEHEDSCCVTIELKTDAAQRKQAQIGKTLQQASAGRITKGARPDYLRFGTIPRNFKGAVLVNELAAEFEQWLASRDHKPAKSKA